MTLRPDDATRRRAEMVERQLAARGIADQRVLDAMRRVPRHEFVDPPGAYAYDDAPQPIGHGATISQPFIVAFMTEALQLSPGDRVLEVGTGSGYGAAVLASIAGHVTTIERVDELARSARRRLAGHPSTAGVDIVVGDGSLGHPAGAPYDAICVTAASPEVPPALVDQLADGGRLVIPVGRDHTALVRLTRRGATVEREELLDVRFVPLRGEQAWPDRDR